MKYRTAVAKAHTSNQAECNCMVHGILAEFLLCSKHYSKKTFGGRGIECIHRGAHFLILLTLLVYFPARSLAHSAQPEVQAWEMPPGTPDDRSLRKIAAAKRLGKVFYMGIRVCLFEGVHLTSSLSRSNGGDSGELLRAASQTLSSHGCLSSHLHNENTVNKLSCWVFDATPFCSTNYCISGS